MVNQWMSKVKYLLIINNLNNEILSRIIEIKKDNFAKV